MQKKIKKQVLILHPYISPYRIDFFNELNKSHDLFAFFYARENELRKQAFNTDDLLQHAQFKFNKAKGGIYFGRHLLSPIYFRIFFNFKPDIVFTHELGFCTIVSILSKYIFGFQLFVTIDDSPKMIKSRTWIKSRLLQLTLRFSDYLLLINPEVITTIKFKYGDRFENKLVFFPILQNEEVLNNRTKESHQELLQIKEKYSLVNKRIILFVGRLELEKRPDLLVESFSRLEPNKYKLIIVGDGSMKNELELLAKSLNLHSDIIFIGKFPWDKIHIWYKISDIFVLPSRYEPFGAVVNEALVFGCFVILSNNVGAGCLINNANGRILIENSSTELSSVITESSKLIPVTKEITSKMNLNFLDLVKGLEILFR